MWHLVLGARHDVVGMMSLVWGLYIVVVIVYLVWGVWYCLFGICIWYLVWGGLAFLFVSHRVDIFMFLLWGVCYGVLSMLCLV